MKGEWKFLKSLMSLCLWVLLSLIHNIVFFFPFNPAGWRKENCQLWSEPLCSLCKLIELLCSDGGCPPAPPEHCDQRFPPLAKSADQEWAGCLCSSMLICQKLTKRPASIGQTNIHTVQMSDSFFWTSKCLPIFNLCVLASSVSFSILAPMESLWACKSD